MEILLAPFFFDRGEFNGRVRIELYEDMEDELESFLGQVTPLVRPKIGFRVMEVEKKEGPGISLEGQEFFDPAVVFYLEKIERVFPYIATCGDELESAASSTDDGLVNFWLDALKQMALDQAFDYFRAHLKKEFGIRKLYSLNPGSSACRKEWDLGDQKKLFSFFPEIEARIGVRLTEGLLMFPDKTISGLMFPWNRDFITCRECRNRGCPNRKTLYAGGIPKAGDP